MSKPVIGLEVHVQLNTLRTKLFCGCSTEYHTMPPNTNTCPVCLGLPGSLPLVNARAVDYAVMVAIALECKVNQMFNFARKNYFYPDMTKNFQISQYEKAGCVPLAYGGRLEFESGGSSKIVRIRRIQLEEDPGRLEHPGGIGHSQYVLVDYNRAGMGLLEIVTEPDLGSPEEARAFVLKLRSILDHLGVCNTYLEGSMRADANVSVDGGNRVEVKNISSFKEIERALQYEINRQTQLLSLGKAVDRETRHWLEAKGITISSRSKEEEQDYRYFPEPDIPPINLSASQIEDLRNRMPELPDQRLKRLMNTYGISKPEAEALILEKSIADFFEAVCGFVKNPVLVANWTVVELQRQLNDRKLDLGQLKFGPREFGRLLSMIETGELSGKLGKRVLSIMTETGEPPEQISTRLGLRRISNETEIRAVVEKVFSENPEAVRDSFSNSEAVNFLIGQVMRLTRGKADPGITSRLVREKLSEIQQKS